MKNKLAGSGKMDSDTAYLDDFLTDFFEPICFFCFVFVPNKIIIDKWHSYNGNNNIMKLRIISVTDVINFYSKL